MAFWDSLKQWLKMGSHGIMKEVHNHNRGVQVTIEIIKTHIIGSHLHRENC